MSEVLEMKFRSVRVTPDKTSFFGLDMEGKHFHIRSIKLYKTITNYDPDSGQAKFYPTYEEIHFGKTPQTAATGDSRYVAIFNRPKKDAARLAEEPKEEPAKEPEDNGPGGV